VVLWRERASRHLILLSYVVRNEAAKARPMCLCAAFLSSSTVNKAGKRSTYEALRFEGSPERLRDGVGRLTPRRQDVGAASGSLELANAHLVCAGLARHPQEGADPLAVEPQPQTALPSGKFPSSGAANVSPQAVAAGTRPVSKSRGQRCAQTSSRGRT